MFKTVIFLYVVFQVLARRVVEVAPLIQDQSLEDAPVVKPSKVHLGSSFTELSAEPVDSSESPEADPLKTALLKKESKPLELPKCINGTLQLESGTFEVTQPLDIPEPCNVNSNGAMLLLSAPLNFSKTARFKGKLSVKGLGSLEGPCFFFMKDAFIQSSAEIRFADCHNVAKDGDDAKGGAIHVRGDLTVTGNLSIHNSSANHGGGIYVHDNFEHLEGNLSISGSSAEKDGGGICVYNNFANSGGEIQISGSSAKRGGGIFVEHSFKHLGGKIEVSNSWAAEHGGGIYVSVNFTNSEGKIEVSNSWAEKIGGGICVKQSFTNAGGEIEISGSSAERFGGGIYVMQSFTNAGGEIQISGSSANESGGLDLDEVDGGAIYVGGNLIVAGNLSIHNCSADDGGGIYVAVDFEHSGGMIDIAGSSAQKNGGGIYVAEDFENSGGMIDIAGSSAQKNGGGIYVAVDFEHSGGMIDIAGSSAQKNGGCLYVGNNAVFANATASFSQCQARLQGGGILTLGNVNLTNASLMFELATAGERSAALQASHLNQTGGDMTVYNSSASSEVISVTAWGIHGGTFHIQDCKAMSVLMAAHQGADLNATKFVVSTSSGVGILLSSGEVTMSSGIFNQTSSPQLRANVVKVTHLSVTGSEASISWASEESTVHDMDCDGSFGGYSRSDGVGCTKCDPGSVFVKNITEKTITSRTAVQHCVPCPDGARICSSTAIKMSPGMMVGQDISRGFHCPNPLACPGAKISVNTNTSTRMCEEGYEDVGCAKCTNDHARSNSNVFVCLKCEEGTLGRVKDVFLFLASDAVIFIISAAGVVTAGRQNKNSKVYLNQLMSFAAVTAPALLALKSTINFVSDVSFEYQLKSLVTTLVQLIPFVSAPVQVGDAGASANNGSTACILRYLGMEPYLASSHFLSSVLYIVLTLSLAAKSGMSVAVVVGINCFLPKFVAAFGSYLTCFRMEPFGKMHCLMGEDRLGATIRAIAFLTMILCFIAGPGLWITMTRDKNLSDKPEVLFLTRSYRKGFESWEVERLVRRMVLKLIGSTIPISVNPLAQMACVSLVLVASLFLHAKQAPYAKDEWNEIEHGLLVTALSTVILTTLHFANARHWARDDFAHVVLTLAIIGAVGVAGFFQSFLLIRELIRERRPQPVNTPEPMEPIEPTEGEDGEVSKG